MSPHPADVGSIACRYADGEPHQGGPAPTPRGRRSPRGHTASCSPWRPPRPGASPTPQPPPPPSHRESRGPPPRGQGRSSSLRCGRSTLTARPRRLLQQQPCAEPSVRHAQNQPPPPRTHPLDKPFHTNAPAEAHLDANTSGTTAAPNRGMPERRSVTGDANGDPSRSPDLQAVSRNDREPIRPTGRGGGSPVGRHGTSPPAWSLGRHAVSSLDHNGEGGRVASDGLDESHRWA